MRELIEYLTKNLVDDRDAVRLESEVKDDLETFSLKVATSDLGKVIGRQGRTIRSLRTVLNAAASKHGRRVTLEVSD